jgi:uncharacterized protein YhfF
MTYLPAGCARPDPAALDDFWRHALTLNLPGKLSAPYDVRWIGLDDESTDQVLELIRTGDKTGTFTLPWLVEQSADPLPCIGDAIILIDFSGNPELLLRLTAIETVSFGEITAAHTAVDGSPVRDLAIWKPLHISYWNPMLTPFDVQVSDDMPILVEKFDLLYAREPSGPGTAAGQTT